MQDVDAVDLVELADAVRELKQRDVVPRTCTGSSSATQRQYNMCLGLRYLFDSKQCVGRALAKMWDI